ncbi:amidohydrolase family protein [Kribbella sp.]|uniref:amidohydrolase family protein n=1 Tax=Kribbella sp. TaxID=1871183 RepID=UPI002D4240A4|nr:amidohydrolase family protein [Kribbella sp.]HZX07294.1 amidohydrolase family protein [Kribbella sp.]
MDQGPPLLIDGDATIGRNPRTDVGTGTPEALLARMDRVGIRTAVVSHTAARWHDPQTGNHRLLPELHEVGEGRLLPCWVGLPSRTGEVPAAGEFVAEARAAGVVAVRVYPEDHGYDLAGPDCAALVAAVAAAGMPLLVDLFQTSWAQIEALAGDHPELAIVVGGIGYRVLRRTAGVLERRPNVSVGTANFSNHLGIEWLSAEFGPERLVFGTGMPERDPAEAVTRLLWSELPDDAVAAIGAGNLERLGVRA